MDENTRTSKKGIAHAEIAQKFLDHHEIGDDITIDILDGTLIKMGLIEPLVGEYNPSNPAWDNHIKNRNTWRARLNNGAASVDMPDGLGYSIDVLKLGEYRIRPIARSFARQAALVPIRINSLVRYKRERLAHLLQSKDWENVPYERQAQARAALRDIDNFQARVIFETNLLEGQFIDLQKGLEKDALQIEFDDHGVSEMLVDEENNV